MKDHACASEDVHTQVLEHLLSQIEKTTVFNEPFSHFYLEEVFPEDIYEQLLSHLPDTDLYYTCHNHQDREGGYMRSSLELNRMKLPELPTDQQDLWRGIASVLTAPELKEVIYRKLAKDLAFRFAVAPSQVERLPGYAKPTLYRETAGFEIAPHTDTRKKIVTMHLYLPADYSQLDLGTSLYRRKLLALPFGPWQDRFTEFKKFPFRPNSGYAFVVNNTLTRRSWHGREKLPADAGVRNTLNNTFYQSPWEGFDNYLDSSAVLAKQ